MNTAEFLNQFVKVVKSDNIADFIQIYQSVDLLIMDDIHHLANKPKTQEVFSKFLILCINKGNK